MSQSELDAESMPGMQQIWLQIQAVRTELANELEPMSVDFPGAAGVRLRRVAEWFRGPAEFDSAVANPDVIAVGLPFLALCSQRPGASAADKPAVGNLQPESFGGSATQFTSAQIAQAARIGACSMISRPVSGNPQRWQILIYPITVFVGAWLLWLAFAFWVAPQFEQMFLEFGIQLPNITMAMLGMSGFVRRWWGLMVALPIGIWLALWLFHWYSSRRLSHSSGLISWLFTSRRDSIAIWAWHLSLLLESGVAEKQAVVTAGEASANNWLKRTSRTWSNRASLSESGNRFSAATGEQPLFCHDPEFQLLAAVVALKKSPAKIALLRELSMYYWERGAGNGAWWLQWLALLLKCLLIAMIFLIVISLFYPLLTLIGGLSKGFF